MLWPSASMVGRTITRAKQAAKTSKPKTVRKSSPMRLEPREKPKKDYCGLVLENGAMPNL
jgi:hypothetical protein